MTGPVLRLGNGQEIPVSQSFVDDATRVQQADLLSGDTLANALDAAEDQDTDAVDLAAELNVGPYRFQLFHDGAIQVKARDRVLDVDDDTKDRVRTLLEAQEDTYEHVSWSPPNDVQQALDELGEPKESKTPQAREGRQGDATVTDTDAEPEEQANDDGDEGAEGVAVENSRRLDNLEEAVAEIRNHVVDQADEDEGAMTNDDDDEDDDEETEVNVDVDEAEDNPDAQDAAEILAREYPDLSPEDVLDLVSQADDDEDDEDDDEDEDENQAGEGEGVQQAQTPTPASPGTQTGGPANPNPEESSLPPGVPIEAYDLGPNDPDDLEKIVQAGAEGEQWATEALLEQALKAERGGT